MFAPQGVLFRCFAHQSKEKRKFSLGKAETSAFSSLKMANTENHNGRYIRYRVPNKHCEGSRFVGNENPQGSEAALFGGGSPIETPPEVPDFTERSLGSGK